MKRKWKPAPEYSAFYTARNRCRNPKDKAFPDYGGRGIKFLFSTMQEWLAEVGTKPSPDHCIDRINNDGNYEHGNLRWATRTESNRNTRPHRVNGSDNPAWGRKRPDLAAWNRAHRTGVTPKPLSANARKIISESKKKYWIQLKEQGKFHKKPSPCPKNSQRHRFRGGSICHYCGMEKSCA